MRIPNTATLGRMATRGTMEVEHLLRLAQQPSPELADAIDELAIEMCWPCHPCFPEVPFGTWAAVVSTYCRNGYNGLLETANDQEMLPFVLGLLEELRTDEALCAVVRISTTNRSYLLANPDQAEFAVGALNLIALRISRNGPGEADRCSGRDFLHGAITMAETDAQRGTILCALRFFGDESSIPLVSGCPPLPPEWEGSRKAAFRAIKRRLRSDSSA